jgi:hypothetical protein
MKSAYSATWTFVSFSFPNDTKAAKSAAWKFTRAVKSQLPFGNLVISRGRGAGMLLGDYAKLQGLLVPLLPDDAELRLVPVTDKQIEKSLNFWGNMRKSTTG